MKISAKNQFKGKITKIIKGAVNAELAIELAPGITVSAIITNSSVEALGLELGQTAYAVIKASNVMVGTDE